MTIATVNNMRQAVEKHGKECDLFTLDSEGHEYSANPNDYWTIQDGDEMMLDEWGVPMTLHIRRTIWEDA